MQNYTPSPAVLALIAQAKPLASQDSIITAYVGQIMRIHHARMITVLVGGVPEVQQAPLDTQRVTLVCNGLQTIINRINMRNSLRARQATP